MPNSRGALADIAPLAPHASGAVALSATAKGSLLAPDVDFTVSSNRLAFGQRGSTIWTQCGR